jgi:CTP:phosphocholine cytidylyltransferase-like protein
VQAIERIVRDHLHALPHILHGYFTDLGVIGPGFGWQSDAFYYVNKKANMTEIWFPRFIATYNTDSGQKCSDTFNIPYIFHRKEQFLKKFILKSM